MLARVVNDVHHCKDDLAKATSWAAIWATLYMAPLALLVWIVHVYWAGKPPAAG
jgi:hypothetical protein